MKTRIISATVGLVLLAAAFLVYGTVFFTIIVDIISLIAVFELLKSTGIWKHKVLSLISLIYAAYIPFICYSEAQNFFLPITFLFVVALFITFLIKHKEVKFSDISGSFFFALLYPFSFACLNLIGSASPNFSVFYLLLAFAAAWISDTGAYFTGLAIGKHKLCPEISPKKTIEGAVGGLVSAIISYLLIAAIFSAIYPDIKVNYIILIIIAPIASILGMIGDLSASVIKREYGIKDYGNIMPGHGGVMDRFDSILFVLPLIYFIITLAPIIKI
ncbi:MAG: phosphatidate cytidylyltransferase [Oscillospiraceae bacterium]|nr:phosphatidate cytidylyltransferase [Oscillospiraceae bacterium]